MEWNLLMVTYIIIALPAIAVIGYAYVSAELYIFDELLPEYISEPMALLLRVMWTILLAKGYMMSAKAQRELNSKTTKAG